MGSNGRLRAANVRTAGLADETMLYVGQAKVIGPLISIDGDTVAATMVGAINQETVDAALAHLGESRAADED
jgi:hypothetical protein